MAFSEHLTGAELTSLSSRIDEVIAASPTLKDLSREQALLILLLDAVRFTLDANAILQMCMARTLALPPEVTITRGGDETLPGRAN